MRVVISGYYGFDNIGDEAILYSVIQAIRKEDPEIDITVLSNEPAVTAETYGVDAVNRWKLSEVVQAIKESDGLISGGGSLMQDETGIRSIPFYSGVIKIAQMLKKPVFVYAQGMGPFNKAISRMIVKHTLKKTTITVRDKESKRLLERVGVKNNITIVPDPVIGLEVTKKTSDWFEQQQFQSKVITVSVREWPSTVPYKQQLADALTLLGQDGYSIVFVPMHSTRDQETSEEVASLMKHESIISPYDGSIEEKIAIIGQSDLLIGMRLHALIFAAITHTPFVPLSYDPKIDAFAAMCDQSVIGHVVKNDWDAHKMYEKVKQMFAQLEKEQTQLKEKIVPLQQHAQATATAAIATIRQNQG